MTYKTEFLQRLNKMKIRTHYAKIVLLDFKETPIKEIQGKVTAGTLNVSSSSAIRRTISLTIVASDDVAKIENVENDFSINKKVRVEIGLRNPFPEYIEEYGEIVWFLQGTFVLSSVNSTRNTSNQTISITAKDKMCLLDGTAGGSFPAPIVLNERLIEHDDGSQTKEYPIIRQIIYEAVNHYGGQDPDHIFIFDLPDQVKMLVKNNGERTIYFNDRYTALSFNQRAGFDKAVAAGEDAGYEMTDFTYPGELVLNAGDTVVQLLDKIVGVLGNYEYFFDINGNFIFREIKNYVYKQSPLDELSASENEDYLPDIPASDYLRIYDNQQTAFSFTDLEAAAALSHSPKYDNVKNDFYVWGNRKNFNGDDVPIRYHLAIDAKPLPNYAMQYMWSISDDEGNIIDYQFTATSTSPSVTGYTVTLISGPCSEYEWREELYRQALYAKTKSGFGYNNNYYYEELLTEWRKLYDPDSGGWNEDVYKNPEKLDFWLDIIDTASEIGKFSVSQIGRRSKINTNDDIKTVYNKAVPDIIFIPAEEVTQELINYYDSIGQSWFQLTPQFEDLFSISSTGASCFDEIRDMLYQHLNYNTTISITCLPVYYLDSNDVIYVEDMKSDVVRNFQITQFSLPLTYNGTMSITATQVFTKI